MLCDKYDGGMVYLGDCFPLRIVLDCRVLIIFPNGRMNGIIGLFHILGLAQNLLSIQKINDVAVHVFSLINNVRWYEMLWFSLRVFVWELWFILMCALLVGTIHYNFSLISIE